MSKDLPSVGSLAQFIIGIVFSLGINRPKSNLCVFTKLYNITCIMQHKTIWEKLKIFDEDGA